MDCLKMVDAVDIRRSMVEIQSGSGMVDVVERGRRLP